MKTYVHHRPFTIKIDLVQGCSMYHSYCGIRTIFPKAGIYNCMTLETAGLLARQLRNTEWPSRVEFEVFGEATEHPQLLELLRAFRCMLPKLSCTLTTNGSGLWKKPDSYLKELSKLVNTLIISHYPEVPWSKKLAERFRSFGVPVEDNMSTAYNKKDDKDIHKIVVAPYIVECKKKLAVRRFANMGCTAAPPDHTYDGEVCARPFRDLVVNWDGSVVFCCVDWRGLLCLGNIHKSFIADIWNSADFNSLRSVLMHRKRVLAPCCGCNIRTVRNGLLPSNGMPLPAPFPKKATNKDFLRWGALLMNKPLYGDKTLLRKWETAPGVNNDKNTGMRAFLHE